MTKRNLALLLCMLCCIPSFAQSVQTPVLDTSRLETYIVADVSLRQMRQLDSLFHVDYAAKTDEDCATVRMCLAKREYADFLALGIPFTVPAQSRTAVRMAHSYEQFVASWNRYPDYNTYLSILDTFQQRYPDFCRIETLIDHTPGGHSLRIAHISNNLSDRGEKPAFLYTSTMHGDEVTGYYVLLRLINHLLANYSVDERVRGLVDSIDIWICPLENPDGTFRTSNDSLNESPYSTRLNYYGEDLNRSYPQIGEPLARNRNRQPEVQAMMDLAAQCRFTMSANLHGGAEVFNYPWDLWTTDERAIADHQWWELVGSRFAATCHETDSYYMTDLDNGITEGGDWYAISGSRQDYFNYFAGCREATIEISANKVTSSNALNRIWLKLKAPLLDYMNESLYGIRGVVTDTLTGEAIEAKVFIQNHDRDSTHTYSLLPYGNYHRPVKAGTYTVTFSAPDYQSKTLTITVNDRQTTCIDVQLMPLNSHIPETDAPAFVLFPNPSSGILFVTSMAMPPHLFDFLIFDSQGRQIYRAELESGTSTLNISSLSAGVYVIHIMDGSSRIYQTKIVKR